MVSRCGAVGPAWGSTSLLSRLRIRSGGPAFGLVSGDALPWWTVPATTVGVVIVAVSLVSDPEQRLGLGAAVIGTQALAMAMGMARRREVPVAGALTVLAALAAAAAARASRTADTPGR